jgi:hypothetical protein
MFTRLGNTLTYYSVAKLDSVSSQANQFQYLEMVRYTTDEASKNEAIITTPPPSYNPSEAPLVYKVGYPPQKNLTRVYRHVEGNFFP